MILMHIDILDISNNSFLTNHSIIAHIFVIRTLFHRNETFRSMLCCLLRISSIMQTIIEECTISELNTSHQGNNTSPYCSELFRLQCQRHRIGIKMTFVMVTLQIMRSMHFNDYRSS